MNRKYFFFDIDGTLAVGEPGHQIIPDSTKQALKELQEQGHFVAIATGRSYAMAHHFLDVFDIDHMVSDGGNALTINRQCLGIEPLDYDACVDLIDECKQLGMPWGFSPDDAQRRLCPDERFFEATHDDYIPSIVEEGADLRDYDQIYKLYIACKKGEEEQLTNLHRLPWCRYHTTYFFVEPTDKAKGIRKMIEQMNGTLSDVVVFGDSLNDMSMFLKDEWTCIAMGNACDELKAKATYVTRDAGDDGIYDACKKFGWI